MLDTLGILLVSLGLACSRDTSKAFRSMPAISNSLVNLGKMDISFHFNSNGHDGQPPNMRSEFIHSSSPIYFSKPEVPQTVEYEQCPCSSLKNFQNPFVSNSPSAIFNKILKSNDLFSYNQELQISPMCCDSHEHVQEDSVFFDFNSKPHIETQFQQPMMSPFPYMLDNILPKMSQSVSNIKPKAIEIFFFPKGKEALYDMTKMSPPKEKKVKKSEIQIVGDRELKNEFRSLKYRPTFPGIPVKVNRAQKDNKEEKDEEKVTKETTIDTANEKQSTVTVEEANIVTKEKTTPAPFTASTVAPNLL